MRRLEGAHQRVETRGWSLESGDQRGQTREWRLESEDQRVETREWRLATGDQRKENGGRDGRLEVLGRRIKGGDWKIED